MTIYFIRAGRHVKIGYTSGDPQRRLRALQTANARRLRLLLAIPGQLADEARLHVKFDAERVTGEWFTYSRRIRDFIKSLKGWTLDVPGQDEQFIMELWATYPDVSLGVDHNAATCEHVAERLRWRANEGRDGFEDFGNWQEKDVIRALHSFGIPTRLMEFWDTAGDAWAPGEARRNGHTPSLKIGFTLEDALEYFMVERGIYWDGTNMSPREISSYLKAMGKAAV